MHWYPASFSRPRTAFSFDLLETYHKLTLQGKLNLYDFYHAIMQKSDNQGHLKTTVSQHDDRYSMLLKCTPHSTDIMRSCAVLVSGDISRASNVGVVPIRHTNFPQRPPGHSRLNVPPVLTLDETFQQIGMPPRMLISESSNPSMYDMCNSIFLIDGYTRSSLPLTPILSSS